MNARDHGSRDRVEYDPETGTYHASYDLNGRYSLLDTILTVVEEATGQARSTIEPLFDVVDPDALETLFRCWDAQTTRVEFNYCGCEVTTRGTGVVSVTVPEDS